MEPITTTKELAAVCSRMAKHAFITVDTEFLRETTYFPILCVAQMASTDEAVVVECVVTGTRRSPFAGVPPTGRRIEVPLVVNFDFDGDLLIGEKVDFDLAALIQQLEA